MSYTIVPLDIDLCREIRNSSKDNHGNLIQVEIAKSHRSPCRSCLHTFNPGEERVLFAHTPFPTKSVFAETGPIYVHKKECETFSDKGFPVDIKKLPLTLRGYNSKHEQVYAEVLGSRSVEEVIEQFFKNDNINYIHVRDAEYGCYILKVERR